MRTSRLLMLCVQESRPIVQVVVLLRYAVGMSLGLAFANGEITARTLAAPVAISVTAFAVYLFNGIGDLAEDRANGSTRPIARGAVSVRQAVVVTLAACLLAALLAVVAGHWIIACVSFLMILGYSYTAPPFPLKRNIPGLTLTGAGLVAATFGAGYLSVADAVPPAEVWSVGGVLCLWTALVGQTKDIPDAPGDELAGRTSLPVAVGLRASKWIFGAAASILAVAFACTAIGWAPHVLPVAAVILVGACSVVRALAISADLRSPYRRYMATQYIACIATIVLALGYG